MITSRAPGPDSTYTFQVNFDLFRAPNRCQSQRSGAPAHPSIPSRCPHFTPSSNQSSTFPRSNNTTTIPSHICRYQVTCSFPSSIFPIFLPPKGRILEKLRRLSVVKSSHRHHPSHPRRAPCHLFPATVHTTSADLTSSHRIPICALRFRYVASHQSPSTSRIFLLSSKTHRFVALQLDR